MASSWLDSWGASWGDAWGQQATDPNALRGTAAGSSTAGATLSAVAWIAGSAAGTSTAQAYLELDGGAVEPAPSGGGSWVGPRFRYRPKDEDETLLLLEIV